MTERKLATPAGEPGPPSGVATDLLARLEPLRFAEAHGEAERDEAYRLRYRAVVNGGMAAAGRFPDGLERDTYDDHAVHILGWDSGQAVATCRLVFPIAGQPLPLETAFSLDVDRHRVVEWGRVAVDLSYRGEGHRVFMGLAARAWLSMQARGYSAAVGVTPERLVRFFRALGFPLQVVGPSKPYWGEDRCPVFCDGVAALRAFEDASGR